MDELLRRTSASELSEWMAFYALEPFGELRADARAGIVAATVANTARGAGDRAFAPADFMPDYDGGDRNDNLHARMMAIAQVFGVD